MTVPFINAAWGLTPRFTPYAKAIVDHYGGAWPWYWTTTADLDPANGITRLTQVMRPQDHDVLILGASATIAGVGLTGWQFIYLNITHEETGIPWAVPGKIGFFPVGALASRAVGLVGADPLVSASSILKLPEAFFLPAHNRLKFDWQWIFQTDIPSTTRLTLIGLQLTSPRNGEALRRVTMPDGKEINVGDRLPWFATIPLGEYQSNALNDFQIDGQQQVTQFTHPMDCDVEVHDIFCNFTESFAAASNILMIKIADMKSKTFWTPRLTEFRVLFGGEDDVCPARGFTRPYLLKRGHRLQTLIQNNTNATTVDAVSTTYRGVRLCEY
jgi:hypothetical protein